MASTPQPLDDLVSALETLLRPLPPAARVAGVGDRCLVDEILDRLGIDVAWIDDDTYDRQEAFAAVLWSVDGTPMDPTATAVRIRRLLADDGLLAVILPETAEAPLRGSLPPKEYQLTRCVLRSLSEAGFAVRGEGRFSDLFAVFAVRDDFRIRFYEDGDEDAILRLFPTCFHVERGLDHWRWKYLDNPYGKPRISMAFSPEGELASHYASYPTPFWIEDDGGRRKLLGLQMGDTMTNPRFRNVGRGNAALLPRTVRHFFAHHRDGRFGFFYGFNTGPIQRFCVRFIGGSKIGPVGYWTRDLEGGEEPPWTAGHYHVGRVRAASPSWDRFFQRVAPHYGFLVHRDARWVDWRYLRCPDADYVVLAASRWGRMVGWGVFRRREDRLVWGDALFHPRHAGAAESLLAAAVRRPELAGARRLEAWFSPRPQWWSRRLPDLGFTAETQPDGLGMVALEDGEDDAIVRLGEMYYTMGDGDLF